MTELNEIKSLSGITFYNVFVSLNSNNDPVNNGGRKDNGDRVEYIYRVEIRVHNSGVRNDNRRDNGGSGEDGFGENDGFGEDGFGEDGFRKNDRLGGIFGLIDHDDWVNDDDWIDDFYGVDYCFREDGRL